MKSRMTVGSARRQCLTVGRFFTGGHNKRQDVVIEAFARMLENGVEGMELALAGAIHPSPEGRARFHELQDLAGGLNCTFSGLGRTEYYLGSITRFGADIGYQSGGVLVWTVVAPTRTTKLRANVSRPKAK